MDASEDVRSRVLRLTIAYLAVIAVVIGVIVGVSVQTRRDNRADTRAVRQLLTASTGLKGTLVDQETAVRGYMLTGDRAYLEPYEAGRERARTQFGLLRRYFRDDEASRASTDEVENALEAWRRAVAEPQIDAVARGDRDAALEIETSGAGREAFDEVRVALDRLAERIRTNRTERLSHITSSTTVLLFVALALAVFAVGFMAVFARNYRRWGRQRIVAGEERTRRALADEREQRWIVAIAVLSERLNRAESVDSVARLIAEEAAVPVGGRYVHLGLIDRDGDLKMVYDRDFAAIEAAPSLRHRGERTPLVEAVRTERTLVLGEGIDAIPMEDVPDFAPLAANAGVVTVTASPLRQGNGQIIGALGIFWDDAVAIDDIMRSRLDELTSLATEALRRAMLADTGIQLAAVSRSLSAAIAEEDIGQIVADELPDVFDAKVANLAVLQRDGQSVSLFHYAVVDGELTRRHDVLPLDLPTPLHESIASGRPIAIESIEAAPDPTTIGVREMHRLGVEAALSVPIVVRGRAVAALGLGWARPRVLDPDDATVRTVTELVGAAVNRATAFRASARVADFAGRLAAANSGAEIAEAVFDVVVPDIVHAASGRFAMIDSDGARVRVFHPPESPDDFVTEFATVPLVAELPITDAIRADREVVVHDPELIGLTWPQLGSDGDRNRPSVLVLPLHDGADSVIGALALAWRESPEIDPGTRALLDTVIELCGTTLERTRLYHLEHELITHMARYLTPARATHPGLEIAGRYEPALSNLGMGGDWYDLVELTSGLIGAVVGDVVGHGVTAVAEMARMKTTIATLVGMDVAVDELFPLTHGILDGPESFRGTAVYAEIDPVAGSLRISSAGHPAPVVRRRGGSVEELRAGSRYPVLGINPGPQQLTDPIPFGPGDLFVAFTDGLVERRGETLDEGIDRLERLLGDLGERPVDEVADAIVATLGGDATDDVALLVIRNAS